MVRNFAFGRMHKLISQNVDVLISLGNQALGDRGYAPAVLWSENDLSFFS
jgi:hypothetical protein